MKVETKDIDIFKEQIKAELKDALSVVAHSGVEYAKEKGPYKNHTYNLRNAPGTAVVINGEIVDMYVPADANHSKAKEKTENLLIYGKRPKDGIMIADGMEYASYVESRGYDVISGAAIHIEKEGQELNDKK